ncbi:MAG: amidohydrolase [Deltaproteobacteria bacterium]|nr:amidohydrolase [Deltaproteobacteria bacterium]MBW2306962.1 amidohydrolase [Deltaproteobacteria bacterium]
MTMLSSEKLEIARAVESRQEKFWKISDAIWSYAELGLEEYKSSKLLVDTLESAGFKVEQGVAGMPTAFVASWSHGTGKPVIGFLGEYDALPMLSQKSGSPTKDPVVPGAPGHGCSHNTMCTMQALTVISLQEIMQKKGLNGTLKVFGSPAEEILVSRPYLVRAGLFKDVDAVIDCHGDTEFKVAYGMEGTAMYSFIVTFYGKTSHAGSSPWMGRSSADAVELMHAGTERMREHLPITQRTHWVTTEGGEAPNVVPDRASTWYYIRDLDENVESNFKWALDCARGAALMTQTTHEVKVIAAVHQRFSNKALAELVFENIKAVGKPEYTEEEEAYARALQEAAGFQVKGMDYPVELTSPETGPLRGGSSDVGDVTLVAPCVSMRYPVRVPGSPSHHWTVVSTGATSIAHKGLTAGAKAASFSAYDLLTNPGVLAKIRAEFEELARERPYKTFLPDGAQPPIGLNTALMEKYRGDMEQFYKNP